MRISDWSSDVCSSDLVTASGPLATGTTNAAKDGDGRAIHCLGQFLDGDHFNVGIERFGVGRRSAAGAAGAAGAARAARSTSGVVAVGIRTTTFPSVAAIGIRVCNSICGGNVAVARSEEHTSEHQSLMRISYAVFCL